MASKRRIPAVCGVSELSDSDGTWCRRWCQGSESSPLIDALDLRDGDASLRHSIQRTPWRGAPMVSFTTRPLPRSWWSRWLCVNRTTKIVGPACDLERDADDGDYYDGP